MNKSVKNTGIIGLGAMGFSMARHMVNKGFDVTGYDIAPEAARRAKEAGIKIAAGPADVGAAAEIVIVMVATDAQVEEVITSSGLLDSLASPARPRRKPRASLRRFVPNAASACSTRPWCWVRKPPTTARSPYSAAAMPPPSRRPSRRSRPSAPT